MRERVRYVVRAYIERMSGEVLPADSRPMSEADAKVKADELRRAWSVRRVEVVDLKATTERKAA